MTAVIKNSILFFCIVFFTACSVFSYTPRSKKNIHHEQPSVILLNKIIDYRLEENAWPVSREEFISKGPKYKEAFDGFPYQEMRFKIIDNNTMTFFFSHHIKDIKQYQETKTIDLNSYGGEVKFFMENNKFIWKLKMY